MLQGHLSDCVKTIVVEDAASAGTSELTSDVVDMAGYDGVRAIALTGDATSGSVITLNIKSNSANSTSSPTPVTEASATYTAGASDADVKALTVDVIRPTGRYVFATLTRTAQNCVINGIILELYRARTVPVTQDATVISHTEAVKGGIA